MFKNWQEGEQFNPDKELEYSVVDFSIGKSPNHDQEQLEIYRKWFNNQSVKDVMWNTYWKMDQQSRLI